MEQEEKDLQDLLECTEEEQEEAIADYLPKKAGRPKGAKNKPKEEGTANEQKKAGKVKKGDKTLYGQEYIKQGDNARYLAFKLNIMQQPKIDTTDEKEVSKRILWYFKYCQENDMKPTLTGLSLAIGVSKKTLYRWKRGDYLSRLENQSAIDKAYAVLESLWEDYMLNGKINPVAGIFIGKNHFGYLDQTEIVHSLENRLGDKEDPEAIRQRYLSEIADNLETETKTDIKAESDNKDNAE
jgi:hypothetical protein